MLSIPIHEPALSFTNCFIQQHLALFFVSLASFDVDPCSVFLRAPVQLSYLKIVLDAENEAADPGPMALTMRATQLVGVRGLRARNSPGGKPVDLKPEQKYAFNNLAHFIHYVTEIDRNLWLHCDKISKALYVYSVFCTFSACNERLPAVLSNKRR